MTVAELQAVLVRYWIESFRHNPVPLLPEARVITGDCHQDSFLHHLMVDCGVDVELYKTHKVTNYKIVDEQKYMLFLLRWS